MQAPDFDIAVVKNNIREVEFIFCNATVPEAGGVSSALGDFSNCRSFVGSGLASTK